MVVQHNMQAMNANRMLGITTSSQSKTTEKLSSGYRINRAADDAAGLTISEKMRKQMRGLDRASTNAQDGVSCVQTAEGALTEVHSMLQRMNELAVQSANGTNATVDREAIQAEIDQLATEIDRVSETTKFNETYLLKGDEVKGTKTVYTYKQVDIASEATIKAGTTLVDKDGGAIADEAALKTILDDDPKAKIYTNAGTEAEAGTGKDYTSDVTVTLKDGVTVYKADGTACTDADDAASVLEGGGKLYKTNAKADGTAATAANKDGANKATAILYNADGSQAFAVGDDVSAVDITAYYTTAPAKEAGDAEYTSETTYAIEAGKKVYNESGKELDNDALKAALDKGETVYSVAPTLAKSGDDYTYTPAKKELAKLYDEDGKEVSAGKIDDMLAEGKKLYSDKDGENEVAEADLKDYTKSATVNEALELNLHVGADSGDNNKISVKIESMSAAGIGVKDLKVDTEDDATAAIDTIAAAIQQVSEQRSALGAIQNRLEHTIANLDNVVENTTAAESRIRDTDMAEMMVEYSKNNILAQAGQSMLAQANQSTQGVLSLLG